MDEAYQATGTACGDTVNIKAGTYATLQRIVERAALSGCNPDVTFRANPGDSVTINQLNFGDTGFNDYSPDDIVIQGPITMPDGVSSFGDSHNITLDNIDGGSIYIDNFGAERATNWLVQNSDWGPCDAVVEPQCDPPGSSNQPQLTLGDPNGITFINNSIHDYTRNNDSEIHFECVRTDFGDDFVWRGNRFWNCHIYGLTTSNWGGTNIVENNWFGSTPNGRSFGVCYNNTGTILIRGNSFSSEDGLTTDCASGSGFDEFTITGNIFGVTSFNLGNTQCFGGATYSYNVFVDDACSGTGNVGNVGFDFYVNGSRGSDMDYHLTGSNQEPDNLVPTSVTGGCASQDYDGDSRPANTNCDAGADERNQ